MLETISQSDAEYACDLVSRICAEVGPGFSGSPQERERAEVLKKELEAYLGLENVAVEEFPVASGAFKDSQVLSGILLLLAAGLNLSTGRLSSVAPWITAAAALLIAAIPVSMLIFQFSLGYELTDQFFPKKRSVNVIGALCRPETQTVKRLLLIGGHHDSAMENTWLRYLGYGFFFASTTMFIGIVMMLVMSMIQLAGVVTGNGNLVSIGTLK